MYKLVCITGFLCAAALASAGEPWDRVMQLPPQTEVRVRTFDGADHRGRLSTVDTGSIRLVEQGNETVTARADVRRVQVHSGTRRLRNVLIGCGIGVAAGVVAAFATCPSCPGETSADTFHARLGWGGLAGAGVGAGLGALGSPYRTIYKAKRHAP